jgi:hypothetical protein
VAHGCNPSYSKDKRQKQKDLEFKASSNKKGSETLSQKKKKTRIKMKRTGVTAHVVETPLACVRPWIQSLEGILTLSERKWEAIRGIWIGEGPLY